MKLILRIFGVSLVLLPSIVLSQSFESIQDSILRDTINMDSTYTRYAKWYINEIEREAKEKKIQFPFCKFDSVICYEINKTYFESKEREDFGYLINKSGKLGATVSKPGRRLNENQVQNLLSVINHPLSFQWGFCGTPIPKIGFAFYNQGKIASYFDLGCSQINQINQIHPSYFKIRQGAFTIAATEQIKEIVESLGIEIK